MRGKVDTGVDTGSGRSEGGGERGVTFCHDKLFLHFFGLSLM